MERRSGRGTYVRAWCMHAMAVSLSAPCDLPEVSRAAEKNIPGKKYECKCQKWHQFIFNTVLKLKDGTYSCYFSLFRSGPPCWCSVSGQPAFNTLSLHSLLTVFLYLSLTVDLVVVCSLMSGYMHVCHSFIIHMYFNWWHVVHSLCSVACV